MAGSGNRFPYSEEFAMSVLRLNSLSALPVWHGQGQCAACEKPVSGSDVAVRIYGDLIHRDCA